MSAACAAAVASGVGACLLVEAIALGLGAVIAVRAIRRMMFGR